MFFVPSHRKIAPLSQTWGRFHPHKSNQSSGEHWIHEHLCGLQLSQCSLSRIQLHRCLHWHWNPEPWMIQNQSLVSSETIKKPETWNTQSVNSGAASALDWVYPSAPLLLSNAPSTLAPDRWMGPFLHTATCIGALSCCVGTMSSLGFTLM